MRELMNAEEWRIHVELPTVALLLSRSVQSNAVQSCSKELLNWLRPSLDARPLDLTSSLEPRVAALGALSELGWNDAAIQLLIRLMDVDQTAALVHFEQRSVMPGPGSRELALGPSPVVSLQTFKAWTATALSRAYVGRRIGPQYADLLVRYFTKAPPEVAPASQREPVTSVLWPDLVRAYELSPNDARWAGLPAPWRARLEALVSGATGHRE
jgi:hypothetical protein